MSDNQQNKNKAESYSLKKIAGNEQQQGFLFEIPPYQRLYEWEKEQIEALLEDVKKAQSEGKEAYFIGNIVVSKKNDRYILIDGQQRLTTLFLIGIYLASKECKECEKWQNFIKNDKQIRISMPLRESEEQWLSKFIEENKGDFKDLDKKYPNIHTKMTKGLEIIAKWFEGENKCNEGQRAEFSKYLYGDNGDNGVRFALVELAEGTDLNQFFVRMNNRGKQLEKHEILKSRLLSVLQKNSDKNDEDWKKYAKIWDLCSDMDKYIFQSASDRKIFDGNSNSDNGTKDPTLLNILKGEGVKNNGLSTYENGDVERVKSIIDFPTFLLHIAKLKSKKDISINKDKLLENIIVKSSNQSSGQNQDKKNDFKLILINEVDVKEFIKLMLRYRILFDYFVIKYVVDENLSKTGEYSIRCLNYIKKSKSYVIGGCVMEKLATIQNYLRVARAGERQNYHHWLTPFLSNINNEISQMEEICAGARYIAGKIKDMQNLKKTKVGDFIKYLEDLDTALAIQQMNGEGEGNLLKITNQWLSPDSQPNTDENKGLSKDKDFANFASHLNQGTGTPHYWFYRLEYYLWKRTDSEAGNREELEIGKTKFQSIREKYRFRGLNSVEHIQPQSKAENEWEGNIGGNENQPRKIDCFGNLALISQSFNSSLSNQDTEDKLLDMEKRINKDDVESLKLWLVFAKIKKKQDEQKSNEKNGLATWLKNTKTKCLMFSKNH